MEGTLEIRMSNRCVWIAFLFLLLGFLLPVLLYFSYRWDDEPVAYPYEPLVVAAALGWVACWLIAAHRTITHLCLVGNTLRIRNLLGERFDLSLGSVRKIHVAVYRRQKVFKSRVRRALIIRRTFPSLSLCMFGSRLEAPGTAQDFYVIERMWKEARMAPKSPPTFPTV
jgi:hypothetical protein